MAVPTSPHLQPRQEAVGPQVVHVTVTARQWWWEFQYEGPLATEIFYQRERVLHIPSARPFSLHVADSDLRPDTLFLNALIPRFWIPALIGKKDSFPGRLQFLKPSRQARTPTSDMRRVMRAVPPTCSMRVIADHPPTTGPVKTHFTPSA